ncbi:hypothetical protein Tco_0828503 [Tanacetum coccineum]
MNIWISLASSELTPSTGLTPDLICPLTYQLLWSSSGDSRPDVSFHMSASPDYLSGLACASLEDVFKLRFFSARFEGDYTSSCPPSLVLSSYLVYARLNPESCY